VNSAEVILWHTRLVECCYVALSDDVIVCVCVCVCACVCVLNVSQELDAKIASLVIELQKKKQGLETEHTETQMMQVSHGSQGSWVTQFM